MVGHEPREKYRDSAIVQLHGVRRGTPSPPRGRGVEDEDSAEGSYAPFTTGAAERDRDARRRVVAAATSSSKPLSSFWA